MIVKLYGAATSDSSPKPPAPRSLLMIRLPLVRHKDSVFAVNHCSTNDCRTSTVKCERASPADDAYTSECFMVM